VESSLEILPIIHVECVIVKFLVCLYSYVNKSVAYILQGLHSKYRSELALPLRLSASFPVYLCVCVPLGQILTFPRLRRTNPLPAASQNWHVRAQHIAAEPGASPPTFRATMLIRSNLMLRRLS
jgi:hypothetical protein